MNRTQFDKNNVISYRMYAHNNNEYFLTAKTDLGARRQAKKIAKENNIDSYRLYFYRPSDACEGEMDI